MVEKLWSVDSGESHIPMKKAFLNILFSTLLVSGSIAFCLLLYFHLKELQSYDPAYCIVEIQQRGPDKDRLPSQYLADILEIPLDQLYPFSRLEGKEARKKLLANPLIKTAAIKKVQPNTLSIEYALRHPIAILSDVPQTALDGEGYLIPVTPFFSSQDLPTISIGDLAGKAAWGNAAPSDRLQLVLSLLNQCGNGQIQSIDVSKVDALSVGQREIIMTLQDQCLREINGRSQLCLYPRILHLHPENYRQQLANYQVLREHLLEEEKQKESDCSEPILTFPAKKIDLRISHLAFLQAE
ncbi:MAG: hypothetical protein WB791_01955 [Waddliaceae bacterium]